MDFFRLLNTVKYLKPVQVYSRIWFRLYRPAPDLRPAPGTRRIAGSWVEPVEKPPSLVSSRRFRFLNEEHECDFPAAWNREEWGKLWLYNLHYFDCLAEDDRQKQQAELIARWIADNPPGCGNGWEPYPLSLRIVNWIKWSLAGNDLAGEALESLAVQVRYLRKKLEFHLLGNHLFANGKALVFAGLFFAGNEAEGWLEKGLAILGREIPEQVLDDGGHFERSPMYHAIIFEDLLDLVNLFRAYGREVPDLWWETAARMGRWLEVMSHPDGGIALFNDAALGIAAAPAAFSDYYRRLTGREIDKDGRRRFLELPQSGYYVMAPAAGDRLLIDCGEIGPDYQPGHAHCGLLSFEMSLGGRRIFVNSGTSTYERGRERLRQRGTAAHNTLMLDGEEQSEIWASHRMGRRAAPLDSGGGENSFEAAHDGYLRLDGHPLHRRRVVLENRCLEVRDCVEGTGRHEAEIYFHLYPGLELTESEAGWELVAEGRALGVLELEGPCEARVEDSAWFPGFGLSMENRRLVLRWKGELPLEQVTRLRWSRP